jgi:hypothetical protein
MAKIVVLAGADDSAAATAALDAASIEYEVVDPTPANILHLVIGMVGDDTDDDENDADVDADADPDADPDAADDGTAKPKKKKPMPTTAAGGDGVASSTKEPPDDSDIGADASAVAEGLMVKIDGDHMKAMISTKSHRSTLYVPSLTAGAKTTYSINESTYSFYPANPEAPAQRMIIERNNHRATLEVEIRQTKGSTPYLLVGQDLADLFKTK